MIPPQQRLEPGDRARGEINKWLVIHSKFAGCDRQTQLDFQRLAIGQAAQEVRTVHNHTAAPARFGIVLRHVRRAQQFVGGAAMNPAQRHPDAGPDMDRARVEPDRLGQRRDHRFARGDHIGHRTRRRQQHGKFVAAQPRHHTLVADHPGQTVGGFHQNPVAGVVPAGIIDQLEPVEIEKHHGKTDRIGARRFLPLDHRRIQPRVERGTIGNPGQRIVIGQKPHTGFCQMAIGDIADEAPKTGMPAR